jgi:RND family efflux transporter MFP subunit
MSSPARVLAAIALLVAASAGGFLAGRAGDPESAAAAPAAGSGSGVASTAPASAAADVTAALPPVPVEVEAIAAPRGRDEVRATGTLRYQREIPLGFKVAGVVRQVEVDIGDRVRAGTLLARLDPAEVSARQRDAQAMLDNTQRDLARTKVMVGRGFMAPAALDNAQMAVDRARASLDALAFDSAKAVIRAPADGVVLARLAEPGQVVTPGSAAVLFGDAASGLVLVAALSDREVAGVREGDPARVTFAARGAAPAEHEASVSRVAAMADARTGAFDVELRLQSPAAAASVLRSGLVGEARIRTASAPSGSSVLGVSALAVIEGRGDRASVYRVGSDGRAWRVPIRIAGIAGEQVLVAEGLAAGDRVVTAGAAYLRNGQRVQIAAPRT